MFSPQFCSFMKYGVIEAALSPVPMSDSQTLGTKHKLISMELTRGNIYY